MDLKLSLQGEYRFEIRRDGEVIQDTGWFDNLIVDQGLTVMRDFGNVNAINGVCMVGAGTNAPSASDTDLQSPYTAVSSTVGGGSVSSSGSPDYINARSFSYSFTKGAIIGNVTEVGIYTDSSPWYGVSKKMFSRALIKDTNGNPITLSLTDIDQLTVYYKLKVRSDNIVRNGVVTVNGVDVNYTIKQVYKSSFFSINSFYIYHMCAPSDSGRYVYIHSANGYVSGTDTSPPNSPGAENENLSPPVASGPYSVSQSVTIGISKGNFAAGIKALSIYFGNNSLNPIYQIEFETPIVKLNTQILQFKLNLTIGR